MALSRVSTTAGLFLSGGANWYRRTSPRAILAATLPALPKAVTPDAVAAASCSLRGRVLPLPESPVSGGAPARRRVPMLNDFVWSGVPRDRWLPKASYREQSGRFPYVDSVPQSTRQSSARQSLPKEFLPTTARPIVGKFEGFVFA
jgi:hypothetical protein